MNAILTEVLYGNASDDFLSSLSPLPFPVLLLSFLSIMSIKNTFPTTSPLVWSVMTTDSFLAWVFSLLCLLGFLCLEILSGFYFSLPSWDFTHPSRCNRSITCPLPSSLFLLSFFPKLELTASLFSFFVSTIFCIYLQLQTTLCLHLVFHIWPCLLHWWGRTVWDILYGRLRHLMQDNSSQ